MKDMWIMGILGLLMLSGMNVTVVGGVPYERGGEIRATVIFEFGNHASMNQTVILPQDNHTAIKATDLACGALHLYLNVTWSNLGAMVNQIGWERNDLSSTGYYWHLMVWNNDSYEWSMSNVGASSLNLKDGDIIAWVYTVDDSNWNPYTQSSASPGHYLPWTSPRGDTNNTGVSHGNVWGHDVIWKFRGQSSWGFSSTPVVADGMIFIADSANLYALNMNGSLIWNNSVGAAGAWGMASPAVYGKYVIIGTSDNYLRAFYRNNGTLAWEANVGEEITSAPVVDIYNKIPHVFIATFLQNSSGKLYDFYLQNGSEAWNLTLEGSDYLGIPAIYHGRIIVPIAGIEDYSYVWHPPYGIQCISEDGKYVWNYSANSSIRSSPVVENDTIYALSTGDNGKLMALDMNGNLKWEYGIGAATAPPAFCHGVIYAGNDSGSLMAIRDYGLSATKLWERKLNGAIKGGILYASGKIVAVTDSSSGTIYCYDTAGNEIWNYIPSPASYLFSSPIVGDSFLLVASNNGYLYAMGDNSSLPEIGTVYEGDAYAGMPIKISVSGSQQYQAILYYRNVSGDMYHAVWMNYTGGKYTGYIPPQPHTGYVYYYITLVNSSGNARSTMINRIIVSQSVVEIHYGIPIIFIVLIYILLWKRKL